MKALVGVGVIVKSLQRFVASFISDCSCSIFSLVSAPSSIVLGWKLQGHRPYLQIDTRYQHTVYTGHTQPFSLNRMSIKTQLNSIVPRKTQNPNIVLLILESASLTWNHRHSIQHLLVLTFEIFWHSLNFIKKLSFHFPTLSLNNWISFASSFKTLWIVNYHIKTQKLKVSLS